MRDYDSNDVETAAALAAEDAEPDWDRPTRAEAEADEREDWTPPAPRCAAGRLVAFHPPQGQPCRCGKVSADF